VGRWPEGGRDHHRRPFLLTAVEARALEGHARGRHRQLRGRAHAARFARRKPAGELARRHQAGAARPVRKMVAGRAIDFGGERNARGQCRRQKLRAAAPATQGPDAGDEDRRAQAAGPAQRENTSAALDPPKARLVETAARMSGRKRGASSTSETGSSGSASPSRRTGCSSPRCRQSTVATASMAPEEPSRCPSSALVATSGTSPARSPKTRRRACHSAASLSGVPVPWTLTKSTAPAARPASASAASTAAAAPAPVGSGAVMWWASQDEPAPASTASGSAPRASARSSGSSTRTAAPSPNDIPARSARNGRQGASSTERRALNPAYVSWHRESEPPAIATSTNPERTAASAAPSARAPEAQAEEKVATGPVAPSWRATASPGAFTCCATSAESRARRGSRRKSPKKSSLSYMPPVLLPK